MSGTAATIVGVAELVTATEARDDGPGAAVADEAGAEAGVGVFVELLVAAVFVNVLGESVTEDAPGNGGVMVGITITGASGLMVSVPSTRLLKV